MIGGGKYGDLCDAVQRATESDLIILIGIGGRLGQGFSLSAKEHLKEQLADGVPALLRQVADTIGEDMKAMKTLEGGMRGEG